LDALSDQKVFWTRHSTSFAAFTACDESILKAARSGCKGKSRKNSTLTEFSCDEARTSRITSLSSARSAPITDVRIARSLRQPARVSADTFDDCSPQSESPQRFLRTGFGMARDMLWVGRSHRRFAGRCCNGSDRVGARNRAARAVHDGTDVRLPPSLRQSVRISHDLAHRNRDPVPVRLSLGRAAAAGAVLASDQFGRGFDRCREPSGTTLWG
jgi:hypothetical protein